MSSAICAKNIVLNRGNATILDDVSINIESNAFVAIVGSNGAGKTSLLRSIIGIYHLEKGIIEIHGKPLQSYSRKELSRLIAYVPQNIESTFAYSVTEFCLMARYAHLSPLQTYGSRDREIIKESLQFTDALHLAGRDLTTLSGGERQRVIIASALAQGAAILLLDEPTHFLDPKHSHEILKLLGKLHRDRLLTVVMVTHDINAASLLADTVVALKQGRIAFDGPTATFMQKEILENIFDTQFTLLSHPSSSYPVVLPEVRDQRIQPQG